MTHPLGRVLFSATALAALVLAAIGAGPKGPRTLEKLLANDKPGNPPAALNPNKEEFDPSTAVAINEAEARVCLQRKSMLSFPCLQNLGPAEAQILASHEHGVSFDALANINQPTAEALAQCESHLAMNGVAQLGAPSADALARCQATLELKGLTDLSSPALAAKLARQGRVDLPNVGKLDGAVLAAFCTAPCDLYLRRLVVLQARDAEVLRNHVGVLDIDGLVNPPPNVLACILCNQGPIGLGAIHGLGDPAPKAVLNALIQCQGSLCLNGLKKLAVAEAEAIRDRNPRTDLDGLEVLDLPTAIALRDCKSVVSLVGVKSLDPDVVKVLLQRDRKLGPGLVFSASLADSLAPHEAKAIRDHPGLSFGNEFSP
jgi:hypothetical protein